VRNKKKEEGEDGELWVFLNFQKSPLTVSLAYDILLDQSWERSGVFYR